MTAGINRTLFGKAQFAHPGLVYLHGKFTFGAPTAAPDAAEGIPFVLAGTDLARADTGDFTLTIPGAGAMDVLAVHFDFLEATDVLSCKLVAIDETARTISFTFYDGETQATPTDPSDNSLLFVTVVLKSRQI